jgi:DNA-directed RNA polymerase II subunit RPB1
MSYYKELDYGNADISTVTGVQFSVLSPDEIERRSVAEIVTQETYDGEMAVVGGLFDRRMGPLDLGMMCLSCGQKSNQCPGHPGHIRLAVPVFHVQFMAVIMKAIQLVCYRCAKPLINLEDASIRRNLMKRSPAQRFSFIYTQSSKVKRCGEKNACGCGAFQPSTIKRDNNAIGRIILEFKVNSTDKKAPPLRLVWTAEQVHRIFKQITSDEAELMGFNKLWCHPDWLICTVLPVPPPSVRPSVRNDTNTRMEDDLTHKLCDIVKTNRALKQKIEANAPKNIIDEWTQLLQYHVSTLIDNNLPGVPPAQQRSGRPLKSIKDRLKSKEGRVRGNLMGKRVDFSARSVISPDPNLEIDELGVPIKIAKNLTFPEVVTKYNIAWLTIRIQNGPDEYPGAKSYKRNSDKQVISLKHINRENIVLELGDIVNRHLVDGDMVLFNRQPSLHKMSMMAHRVRIMPYNTFRLNPNVTTPYNADFDGDEMNMHVPQSKQTQIELEALASVPTQIITPAQNRPIISIVQDTLVGAYRFTKYDNFLNRSQVMDLLVWNKRFDGTIPPPDVTSGTLMKDLPRGFPVYKFYFDDEDKLTQDLWSGRTILSTVLPKINITKQNDSYSDDDPLKYQNVVKIVQGKILDGVFDKSLLGGKEQGIIHIIYNEYGPRAAKEFLDNIMSLITNWMLMSGFSVGISDLVINNAAQRHITDIIKSKKTQVASIIQSIHDGTFSNDSGKANSLEFEIQVNGALNSAIQDTGIQVAKHQVKSNRMVNMVESGSKGTKVNIAQITACVGQQNVDGKRCPYGFSHRTLPHFNKFDDGPLARGFVENSFLTGLNPQEFFFHSMGGREGIIDTAIKTSESGYIQRKLVKAMEDIVVCQDQTVRTDNGNIVQFLYGEDGMNPENIEKQRIPSISMNAAEIAKNYLIAPTDNWIKSVTPAVAAEFKRMTPLARTEFYAKMLVHYQEIMDARRYLIENVFKYTTKSDIYYPVNVKRIITNAQAIFQASSGPDYLCDMNPLYILERISYLQKMSVIKESNPANCTFHALLNAILSPKYIMNTFKITRPAFDYIIEQIELKFKESFAVPGQLVGVIAAQSIGEPCTQMTLNTFHFAGISAKSAVTRGLPRLKEIISVSKNMKSPTMTVFIDNEHKFEKEKANAVLNTIEITTLKDICTSSRIYFDPVSTDGTKMTLIDEDKELMEIYEFFQDIESGNEEQEERSPWILRLEFNKSIMFDKDIRMSDIYYIIQSKFNNDLAKDIRFVYSDDNASKLIFRFHFLKLTDDPTQTDSEDMIMTIKNLEKTVLNDIVIKGIKGINSVSMEKTEGMIYRVSPNSDDYVPKSTWVLYTEGSNFVDILCHPNVDASKTYTNSIYEIYETLGVEAVREMLINEITELIGSDSTYVNYRHIALLADTMVNRGGIMSIDRHGINKSDRGPLPKCSFEETTDMLAKAAIFGELDKMTGVSANIMFGQEVHSGTGFTEALFDEEKYFRNLAMIPENEVIDENVEIEVPGEDRLDDNCEPGNFEFTTKIW